MISYTRVVMLILLSSPSIGAGFLSTLRAQLHHASASPRCVAGRPYHSASKDDECIRRPVDAPYFAIYYNDVYEVDLPPGHRFPMAKYRIVREAVQAKVDSLRGDEKARVRCGEFSEQKPRIAVRCLATLATPRPHRPLPSFLCEEFRVSPLATEAQLVTTHDACYVRRYLTGEMTESENRNIGFPWR